MKKLEKINSAKFEIPSDKLNGITGGQSYDTSYEYTVTLQDNGNTIDKSFYDICRDYLQ